ncbi:hypothetical protein [Mycolicibacterium mageritense]|uniref:hypothetical protein n=1 Tax=Mycolicibacterium mageritense TaxID=53462 RepID=UPI0011D59ACC|nr:hypothetical protein [Mycolicibacterium mageritense]TXI62435.1 MAG: hypothetical protein E6Q55_13070 [Mycolicibacterium mageritense]
MSTIDDVHGGQMAEPIQQSAAENQPWRTAAASTQQQYPAPPVEPIFQVSTMTHIGALILWFNQRRVVTGTYAQCDAALRSAQTQNLLVGWWSFLSILIMNWVALVHNVNSRKKLNRDLQQAQAYAQWWHQYHAHPQPHVPSQSHM